MNTTRERSYYEKIRKDELKLSREEASERLQYISPDMLEKMETGKTNITPEDAVTMSTAYKHPEICNYYCKNDCAIGKSLTLAVEIPNLPEIILNKIAALNELNPCINDLIRISHDGNITEDEIQDFAKSEVALTQLVLAANTLKLWIEKSKHENNINSDLLEAEIQKLLNK